MRVIRSNYYFICSLLRQTLLHNINVRLNRTIKCELTRNLCRCLPDNQETRFKLAGFFPVSGVAYPGELLAILGSSGSGKTTLLNALTFRSSSNVVVTGLRCCNGTPANPNSLFSKCAYVQQEDLFMNNLTVEEHLIFQVPLLAQISHTNCR